MTPALAATCLAAVISILIWLLTNPANNPLAQLASLFMALNSAVTNTVILLPKFYRMWRKAYPATRRRVHRDLLSAPCSELNKPAPVDGAGAGLFTNPLKGTRCPS